MVRKTSFIRGFVKNSFFLISLSLMGVQSGCTTPGGVYSNPEEEKILGDKWNNSDANKVANYMVDSSLSKPWLREFKSNSGGKKPVVVVSEMDNRTDEHIDTRGLTEAIRSELINSRKVRFLNAARRKKILEEIQYQQSGAVAKSSRKSMGKQIGADYIISGAISSIVSQQGDYKTVTYRVDMNITNIETSEIEWNGYKKIKKSFKR